MKKRIILFFVFILLTLLASAIFIIETDKQESGKTKSEIEFCHAFDGYISSNIIVEREAKCSFLFGEDVNEYLINLENKCFSCKREKCLYDNILETKGVLCK